MATTTKRKFGKKIDKFRIWDFLKSKKPELETFKPSTTQILKMIREELKIETTPYVVNEIRKALGMMWRPSVREVSEHVGKKPSKVTMAIARSVLQIAEALGVRLKDEVFLKETLKRESEASSTTGGATSGSGTVGFNQNGALVNELR